MMSNVDWKINFTFRILSRSQIEIHDQKSKEADILLFENNQTTCLQKADQFLLHASDNQLGITS